MTTPGNDVHLTGAKPMMRLVTRASFAGLVCAATLLCVPAMGSAAPTFGIDVTRDQASIDRGDQYVSYKVTIRNTAPSNPGVGTTLGCQTGAWTPSSGAGIPALTYQWLRDGVLIAGAASASYALQAADAGRAIQCQVTGTNTAASSSGVTAPIVAAPAPATAPPAPTAPFAASARPTITPAAPANVGAGVNLTCNPPAGWSGAPDYTFQWLANGAPIAGATNALYTTQAGDLGKVLQCRALGTNAGGAAVAISLNRLTTGAVAANVPANAGAAANPSVSSPDAATGTTALSVGFPSGMKMASGSGGGWTCQATAATCTTTATVPAGGTFPQLTIPGFVYPDEAPDDVTVTFTAYGGGASQPSYAQDSFVFGPADPFGLEGFTAGAFLFDGADDTRAGGHPFKGSATFKLNTRTEASNQRLPVEAVRSLFTELPVGFLGNLNAIGEACTFAEVRQFRCPVTSAVGAANLVLSYSPDAAQGYQPIYRVLPEPGNIAAFAFMPDSTGDLAVVLRVKLRSTGDYGVTVNAPLTPQGPTIIEARELLLCSFGAALTDFPAGQRDRFEGCKQPSDPGARQYPFLTNPTECAAQAPVTRMRLDSWEHPGALNDEGFPDLEDGAWKSSEASAPHVTACDQVPFDPAVSVTPTSAAPDSASGLDVGFDVPQDGLLEPDGIATSHLKKTVVHLPEGFSVNPSAATGLAGCSDAQMDTETSKAPGCPDGSRLGTVEVHSPLLDKTLTGVMYLGTPKSTDPASGEMLRLWLVVRDDELGISVKLPGSTTADTQTGQLTATFDNNPRVPFDRLDVRLKSGERGVLSTPQRCGDVLTTSTLTPWSGTAAVDRPSPLSVTGDCTAKFAPKVDAGNTNPAARGTGTFTFKFARNDGEQWVNGLVVDLPAGLLASVKDVPLCTDDQAAAGACPAGSRIGTVDATAGTGNPFVLEKKGSAYLTEGYKGCAYGLAVVVPVVAGPFDGKTPETDLGNIVVRQSVCVDRADAHVTVTSDALPTIWHGIPLRVRSVTVDVDRDKFMLNPSDCALKQIGASLASTEAVTANLSDPFQVSGCASLPFKPKLKLALTGRKQVTTGKHPGIKATVIQAGTSEAGIKQAVVRLPKSLALDPNNAQALCEFSDGTKPDLENYCPKGSIVGRARAKTPLLKNDLVGNVYFVKNIRIDPKTGNQIRTLPMVIVALRGEIAINLRGESSTTNSGKLVNTFASVPDAPITQFNLNIQGGSAGIIAVTRTRKAKINLCAGRHIAETDMDGQNGRRHDFDVRMKTPCTRKQTKAAKLRAKRAAAQAKRS